MTFSLTREIYLFIGGMITAVFGLLAAWLTSGVQLKIARNNSQKDVLLQQQRLTDERQRTEAALEREKSEKLHKILSTISFEFANNELHPIHGHKAIRLSSTLYCKLQ